MTTAKRVLILGLDSAPLDLLDGWIQQGLLPNLGRLIQNGASGVLRSTLPPLSPAAWSSFATGMNPGKHGVYDHAYRRAESYEVVPTNGRRRAGKTVWQIIGEQGDQVGVINVPETYPPEPVNGFLITGMSTPSDESDFCYPKELEKELQAAVGGYQVYGKRSKENLERSLAGMLETAPMRIRAAAYLMKTYQPRFMMLVLQETDSVQHRFWKYMDSSHPQYREAGAKQYGDAILRVYQAIDENLPPLLDQFDEDDLIIVMSDHGAGPIDKWLHLNHWLVEQGWIQFKNTPRVRLKRILYQVGFTPQNLMDLVMRLRLGITDRAATQVRKSRSSQKSLYNLFLSFQDVDWSRTKAYSLGGNMTGIFVNLRGREPAGCVEPGAEYEAVREEVIARLPQLRDEQAGVQVPTQIHRREEIYSGPYLDRAPDVLFETCNEQYVGFGGQEFTSNATLASSSLFNGCHRQNGMVALSGKMVKKGVRMPPHDIIDLAPTILYLLGIPVPADMDGSLISDAFLADFLREQPLQFAECDQTPAKESTNLSYEEEMVITERLKELGYL